MSIPKALLVKVQSILPSDKKRVALFGGSFNPPHLAHAMVAISVLSVHDVDELWILPTGDHPFGKTLAPFEDRMALCQAAFSDLPRVKVLEIEKWLPHPTYTVQTLEVLHQAIANFEPKWVIGTDILDELHLWREPERLQALSAFIILPREGYKNQGILEHPLPNISSTEARRRLAQNLSCEGFLSRQVLAEIKSRGLYT